MRKIFYLSLFLFQITILGLMGCKKFSNADKSNHLNAVYRVPTEDIYIWKPPAEDTIGAFGISLEKSHETDTSSNLSYILTGSAELRLDGTIDLAILAFFPKGRGVILDGIKYTGITDTGYMHMTINQRMEIRDGKAIVDSDNGINVKTVIPDALGSDNIEIKGSIEHPIKYAGLNFVSQSILNISKNGLIEVKSDSAIAIGVSNSIDSSSTVKEFERKWVSKKFKHEGKIQKLLVVDKNYEIGDGG